MPIGRPRTISFTPEEMIKLGKEMVQWVKDHDPLHISQFYCIEKGYTDKEWNTMHVAPEFFPYYEQALKIIAIKYLDKDSKVRNGVAERFLRFYFKDLKKEEDETKKFDAELKAKALIQEAQAANLSDLAEASAAMAVEKLKEKRASSDAPQNQAQ
jgi:hypothetical protein